MQTTETTRPSFADRDDVYAPIVSERMALPMPAHMQARFDALKSDARRAKFQKARADAIRAKVHDEHVRAGFWK